MKRLIAAILLFASPAMADPLDGLEITPEVDAEYDRNLYIHWTDDDGDCLNTRHEVLIEESYAPVTLAEHGCSVVEGLWYDPSTGQTFTDPTFGRLQIDHLVPLKEAHQSGAFAWTEDRRKAYANDMENPGHDLPPRLVPLASLDG